MTFAAFPYDTADYLDTEEAIAIYAEEALTDLDPEMAEHVVRVIVRARGLNVLAASTGLPRRVLVDALSGEDPNPYEIFEMRFARRAPAPPRRLRNR